MGTRTPTSGRGFELLRIDWSEARPAPAAPAGVATLAESGDQVAVYSELGIFLWASGSTAGTDVRFARGARRRLSRRWACLASGWSASTIRVTSIACATARPSVWKMSARAMPLADKPVREVVALGKRDGSAASSAVFGVGEQLALSDGVTQKFFDLPLRTSSPAMGAWRRPMDRRCACGTRRPVRCDEWSLRTTHRWSVRPFSPDGLLWVATPTRCTSSAIVPGRGAPLPAGADGDRPRRSRTRPVARAARGRECADHAGPGARLSAADPDQSPAPAGRDAPCRLKSTDVWTIGSDGNLARYGQESGTGRDLAIYREKLVPIFGKYCQSCHLPSGSAHIDMTTYSSWTRLRAQVMTRVVARTPTPMPPTGAGTLTEAELADVKAWAERNP